MEREKDVGEIGSKRTDRQEEREREREALGEGGLLSWTAGPPSGSPRTCAEKKLDASQLSRLSRG